MDHDPRRRECEDFLGKCRTSSDIQRCYEERHQNDINTNIVKRNYLSLSQDSVDRNGANNEQDKSRCT